MTAIEHDAEFVGALDIVATHRREAAPFHAECARVGRVGELVGAIVHRAGHAHAELVEGVEQGKVLAQLVGVLDRGVDDFLAARMDAGGVGRGEGEFELVRVRGDHLVDRHRADQRRVPHIAIAFRRQRALAHIDDPEAAIEAALDHTRIVDLRSVPLHVVPRHDVVATEGVEEGGRVEVGVERHETVVDRPGFGADSLGSGRRHGRAAGQRGRADEGQFQRGEGRHRCLLIAGEGGVPATMHARRQASRAGAARRCGLPKTRSRLRFCVYLQMRMGCN